MSAERERAIARVVFYQEMIDQARSKGQSTEALEEQLQAALVLAELNEPL